MNVKSVEKNGNQATIVVEIDKDLMESGVQKAYLKARKNILLPGFRKGKAPRKMIESMYGEHVFFEDGLQEIFPQVYEETVAKQEGFKAIGRPDLADMQFGDDGSVTVTLKTEVYPEVTLGQYKGLEVEKETASVSEDQVQAELDRMAQNVASTEAVERPAEMGDTANIDFEGFDNGIPFQGGKGENYDLKLGSGSFVPGFEEQIVGMKAGEQKDIDITFPEDYHAELAGKAVVFHIKVNKLSKTVVPALDDEFAKDVSEFNSLDELKADIRAKALENEEKQIEGTFEQACLNKAADNTTVDMPKALVEAALDDHMERFAYQLQMSGYSLDAYAKMMGGDVNSMRSAFRPVAEKQARINVTLAKIIEEEKLDVTEEEIEAELENLAKQYEMDVAKVKELVPADEIKNGLTTKKATKLIVDSAVAVAPKAKEEKAPAKKPAAKKATTAKKTTAKKSEAEDTTEKKAPAKKPASTAKKTTTAKKEAGEKAPAAAAKKETAAKKPAAKKTTAKKSTEEKE